MKIMLNAACRSRPGNIRSKNEDNFCFNGKCLPAVNDGTQGIEFFSKVLSDLCSFAVFDGMGGENYGEEASHSSAESMLSYIQNHPWEIDYNQNEYLEAIARSANSAVLNAARKRLTSHMGSTMACLGFWQNQVCSCNVGDSRIYRQRAGYLQQLSVDHVSSFFAARGRKAPLTQHLGIDPEEMIIEPYIFTDEVLDGDQYLICSDGLTDMLTDNEISDILFKDEDCAQCVDSLVKAALDHGGKDNVTAILCRVSVIHDF